MTTSTVETTVIGYNIAEGTSKKTGNPYSIGKLYAMYPQTGKGVGGYMAAELNCEPSVLRKIEGMAFPAQIMIETANVMQWGKLTQQIMSLSPVGGKSASKAA